MVMLHQCYLLCGLVGLLPVLLSQMTLGRIGDFLMAAMNVVVVTMAVSHQIHSLSAIFMYDIYQTYINPFRLWSSNKTVNKNDDLVQYLRHNNRSLTVRYVATLFFSVLSFPAALAFMFCPLETDYKVSFIAIIVASSVMPVCMSVIWYRTTAAGFISGILTGMASGIAVWLLYATFTGSVSVVNDYHYQSLLRVTTAKDYFIMADIFVCLSVCLL